MKPPLPHSRYLTLSDRLPELAAEWHPTLNGALMLDQFTTASTQPIWWQCPRFLAHVWQASIKSRYSKQSGCRRCQLALGSHHKTAFHERTLAAKSPLIAATWHPTKNGPITPHDVTFRSRYRAWWQCPVHAEHIWDTTVHDRHRSGCPYCAGYRARQTTPRIRYQTNLLQSNPALAREWHATRNRNLQPAQFTAGSSVVVWWQCPRDAEHVYQARINARTRKRAPATCPTCATIRRTIRAISQSSGTGMTI